MRPIVTLLSPFPESFFDYPSESREIVFKWSGYPDIGRYHFELAKDKSFSDVIIAETLQIKQISVESLKVGNYFWRVRIDYGKKNESLLSEVRKFNISHGRSTILVTDILPEDGFEIEEDNGKVAIDFSWNYQGPNVDYKFEISRSEGFRNKIKSLIINDHKFHWTTGLVGQFFWRVASVDKWGRPGKFSSKYRLRIRPSPVHLHFPKDEAKYNYLNVKPRIKFKWQGGDSGHIYTLMVATDPEFKNIVLNKKTNKAKFFVKSLDEGSYFWKVTAKFKNSKKDLVSVTRSFNLKKVIPLDSPKNLNPSGNYSLSQRALDHGVRFTWEPIKGALAYQIEVSRSRSFKRPIVNYKVGYTAFTWDCKGAGEFYWRVKAIDKWRLSGKLSGIKNLSISPERPQLLGPKDHRIYRFRQKVGPIDFEWSGFVGRKNHRLVVAKDLALNQKLIDESMSDTMFQTDSLPRGKYYWQVTSKYEGLEKGVISEVRSFEIITP
tara:strand:+ start:38 stop:1513 length:1476 start_codon:yes stop_codon:yes gene_type:complete